MDKEHILGAMAIYMLARGKTTKWMDKEHVLMQTVTSIGAFKDGLKNGKGTLTWADGEKYVGEFKDNLISGQVDIFFCKWK